MAQRQAVAPTKPPNLRICKDCSVRTLIVVPTYFEVDTIGELLNRLVAAVPSADVIVIDDGSTDGTCDVVSAFAADHHQVVLRQRPQKRGLGSAYRDTFGSAISDYDLLVEIDADLSHEPEALPELLSAAHAGADVVIGSRYVPGGQIIGWSKSRLRLSRWGNRYASLVLGLAINDATAGFRVYRSSIIERFGLADIKSDGYGFQVEMTYQAVRAGARIVEIPITFRERETGESKMSRKIVIEAFLYTTIRGARDLLLRKRSQRMYRAQ